MKLKILIGAIVLFILFISISIANEKNVKLKLRSCLHDLIFVPHSSLLAGSCNTEPEGSIKFWSVENGELIDRIIIDKFNTDKYEYANRIALSHDGKFIAVAFLGKAIGVYALEDKKWRWRVAWLEEEPYGAQAITYTNEDDRVIAVGAQNTVIYNAISGEIIERQKKPLSDYPFWWGAPRGNVLSINGRYLMVWQELSRWEEHRYWWQKLLINKWVTVWDIKEKKEIAKWEKPENELCSTSFSSDEKNIYIGFANGYVSKWSISEQKKVKEWNAHGGTEDLDSNHYWPDDLKASPDGQMLATSGSYTVKVWDLSKAELIHEFSNVSGATSVCGIYPMAFSSDSKYFALEKNGYLCLYETETWQEKWCVRSWPEDKWKQPNLN
ncbi:MAG: WD40 repeat domain-containing protein [Thermodesulfovibrionia bacterium]|nr:WD40 repeat domain-containing protein [Thermodesulfovibrionia bacterium]